MLLFNSTNEPSKLEYM